jgi:hypothetical protein
LEEEVLIGGVGRRGGKMTERDKPARVRTNGHWLRL